MNVCVIGMCMCTEFACSTARTALERTSSVLLCALVCMFVFVCLHARERSGVFACNKSVVVVAVVIFVLRSALVDVNADDNDNDGTKCGTDGQK